MSYTYTDKEVAVFRKYHYKRGFKIGVLIVLVPLLATTILLMQLYINANI